MMKWFCMIMVNAVTLCPGYSQILWEDHFGSTGGFSETQFAHYKGGIYHIYAKSGRVSYHKDRVFDNAAIQVRTEFIGHEEAKGYGLIFRAQDYDNFYVFAISGNGYYFFGKEISDKHQMLIQWTESSVIHQKGVNYLAVSCEGPVIELFINGQAVNRITDPSFSKGRVGLIAYNDVHAHFDDLIVYRNSSGLGSDFPFDPEPVHRDNDFSAEKSHLYFDNFDVMNDEWSQSENVYYERGYYTIWNQSSDHFTWHTYSDKNFAMEASMMILRWPEGDSASKAGLIVRSNKNTDFYAFAVTPDSRLLLKKRTNSFDQVLQVWNLSGMNGILKLKVSADNDHLQCWVNDHYLGKVKDEGEPHPFMNFGFFASKGVQMNVYSVNLSDIQIDWGEVFSSFFFSPVFMVSAGILVFILITGKLSRAGKRKMRIDKIRNEIVHHIEKKRGSVSVTGVMQEYDIDLKAAKQIMEEACSRYKGHHLVSQDGNDWFDFPDYFSSGKN